MNFSTLQGLTIPEGVVTQITDANGRVIWAANGSKVVLQVEKITSNTYAGGTTYTDEQFILLDVYPKTNGTVSVTYGGLTKTITDTSGVEEPNAQQVFFGTFNGVSDSVATPASGKLTIEGDYYGYGNGTYSLSSKDITQPYCECITSINSFGKPSIIPTRAFGSSLLTSAPSAFKDENVIIPDTVQIICLNAFVRCDYLKTITIGKGVIQIEPNAINAPSIRLLGNTPPELIATPEGNYTNLGYPSAEGGTLEQIIVPKGCGNTYKTATGWTTYADLIVEAS